MFAKEFYLIRSDFFSLGFLFGFSALFLSSICLPAATAERIDPKLASDFFSSRPDVANWIRTSEKTGSFKSLRGEGVQIVWSAFEHPFERPAKGVVVFLPGAKGT